MEREKNGVLAFLDLKIERVGEKVVTSVYRKETHTFRYLHWRPNHPKKTKLGVMKCLIHRAHRLCDWDEDLRWELGFLKDQFISNGYLMHEVDRVFASYVPGVEVKEEEEYKPTIFAPFMPGSPNILPN